jgi:hypothetical protein
VLGCHGIALLLLCRSLNLATCVGIGVFEALRQLDVGRQDIAPRSVKGVRAVGSVAGRQEVAAVLAERGRGRRGIHTAIDSPSATPMLLHQVEGVAGKQGIPPRSAKGQENTAELGPLIVLMNAGAV